MKIAFNYKLKKDKHKSADRKVVTNRKFGTNFYSTVMFYKHLTRYFLPAENNE
jgi:protein involved in sex pheromone biosynthesis